MIFSFLREKFGATTQQGGQRRFLGRKNFFRKSDPIGVKNCVEHESDVIFANKRVFMRQK